MKAVLKEISLPLILIVSLILLGFAYHNSKDDGRANSADTPTPSEEVSELAENPCGNREVVGHRETSWGESQVVCAGNSLQPQNERQ